MADTLGRDLAALLDDAEHRRSCATTTSRATRRALLRAVETGALASPHPGLFVREATWRELAGDPMLRTRYVVGGLSSLHPHWIFCSHTAAALHGLPISHAWLGKIHVTASATSHYRESRRIAHHRIAHPHETTIDGIPVTSLARTTLDVLRETGLGDGLAVADFVARARGWSRGELIDALERSGERTPGMARALRIAQHVDPKSESGGESIARALMIKLGFVLPELQVRVANPLVATAHFRVDFAWILPDGTVVIGELDGREKYRSAAMIGARSSVDVFAEERLRESLLTMTGARIVRFSFSELGDSESFERKLLAFGVPKVDSSIGRLVASRDSAMHGGMPAPNGAMIRDGRLLFEDGRRANIFVKASQA